MRRSIKRILAAVTLSVSLVGFIGQIKAAEYAFLLKTLANPFWQQMKAGAEAEAKKLGVQLDVYAAPSESDVQAQLTLFEDLLNKNYKGIAFAPLSSVNLVQTAAKAYKRESFSSIWTKRLIWRASNKPVPTLRPS